MNRQWSQEQGLFSDDALRNLTEKVGVYRIRAMDANGKAVPLPRIGGTDREGTLHIGKSVNLKRRLARFRRVVESGDEDGHHQAACEFVTWRFKRLFPVKRLAFDYVLTNDEAAALKLERELHAEYRLEFMDRPPLDGTSGQGDDSPA